MDMRVPDAVKAMASRATLAALTQSKAEGLAQYLCFSVAGDIYAMSIAAIKEIIELGAITSIPLTPDFISGVINLRGAVVPVIDLAPRLGCAPTQPSRRTCIVIVEMQHEDEVLELGVIVDGVSEVLELGAADLEPPPNFGARIRSDFIEAMARIRGRFVIVMRLDRVLSIGEVADLVTVAASGPANASDPAGVA